MTDGICYEFSKFDVNIWKNNQNEGLQKEKKKGPIICTVENEIPKYQTGYMQNSFLVGP